MLVCADCDPPGGFDKGAHEKEHSLLNVRAMDEEEEEVDDIKILGSINESGAKVDGKLVSLHESLSTLQGGVDTLDKRINTKIASLDDKFGERLKAMEQRFSRVEELLEVISGQRAVTDS